MRRYMLPVNWSTVLTIAALVWAAAPANAQHHGGHGGGFHGGGFHGGAVHGGGFHGGGFHGSAFHAGGFHGSGFYGGFGGYNHWHHGGYGWGGWGWGWPWYGAGVGLGGLYYPGNGYGYYPYYDYGGYYAPEYTYVPDLTYVPAYASPPTYSGSPIAGQGAPPVYAGPIDSGSSTSSSAPVWVRVHVPGDAQLWFDGTKTKQTGTDRVFQSPPVPPTNRTYSYDLEARWTQGGKEITQTRTVEVQPGRVVDVDFTQPSTKGANRTTPP